MYETGVPLCGVHIRRTGANGFRAIDAIRLDTGLMVKLIGEFSEIDPMRPFVADLLNRRVPKEAYPADIEYRVGPGKTGPETVGAAVRRKRAEDRDPASEIPEGFRPGYVVTETECVTRDKTGGTYRIFMAEIGSTKHRAKIVARVPDPDRPRHMRMAIRASKDRNGNPQREGIYMGDVGADPVTVFAPELLTEPKRTPTPTASSREETEGDGKEAPKPDQPFRTEPTARETRRDVASGAGPGDHPDRTVEQGTRPAGPVSERPKGAARLMRIQYDATLNRGREPYVKAFPRKDGTVQHFTIFNARDLDTGKSHKVKLFLPDADVKRERQLYLETVMDRGRPVLKQSSAHPPPEVAGVDFENGEWERLRVIGERPIFQQEGGDLDELFHIFDAKIIGTDHVLKIKGVVPGGDTERPMTVLVRPTDWYHGEIQYEAGLVEPDPDVPPEAMVGMIRRMQVPGLGDELIERVVSRFGNESLHVIRYEPEQLLEVRGIGEGTVAQIRKATHLDLNGAILSEMSRSGVHLRYFMGIRKTFAEDAVEIIREHPYRLTAVNGLSFRYADEIAVRKQGRSDLSPERVDAVLSTAVDQLIGSGKTGEYYFRLKSKILDLTSHVGRSDEDRFSDLLWDRVREESRCEDGLVRIDPADPGRMIRFQKVVRAERRVSEDLYERAGSGPDWIGFDPSQFLAEFQRNKGFALGAEQAEAVRMVCRHGTSVMTGGPGVGKTTTLKAIVEALEGAGVNVLLAAPTGIASKRMSKATGRGASTVHSTISQLEKVGDEVQMIPVNTPSCLVIDESSMVNAFILDKLLASLPMRVSVLFCGDVDQLPSIGPGQVLHDLISSGMVPVTRLNTVYRTSDKNGIVDAARAINAGNFPPTGPDFEIIEARTPEEIRDETLRQVTELCKLPNFNPFENLMVLPPVKKGPAGVVSLNTSLQALLNPPTPLRAEISVSRPPEEEYEDGPDDAELSAEERKKRDEREKVHHEILRVGDKVIKTRNDFGSGLVNGDTGIITHVDPQTFTVCVDFYGDVHVIEKDGLKDIRLAYAMTVHKSQGSEADYVIAPLPDTYKSMLTRPLLYTGVTRGKTKVSVIGAEETVAACIANTAEKNPQLMRHSTLAAHCRDLMENGLDREEPEEDGYQPELF